tara:strand:+ start:1324 stop:1548 length:225 start_codon:yes stop_codon:yes gene_type:complete
MKGVKYNLKITLPHDETHEEIALNMEELCNSIKNIFKLKYYINIKCNNQIIYNLINRPHTTNKILQEKVNVIKV